MNHQPRKISKSYGNLWRNGLKWIDWEKGIRKNSLETSQNESRIFKPHLEASDWKTVILSYFAPCNYSKWIAFSYIHWILGVKNAQNDMWNIFKPVIVSFFFYRSSNLFNKSRTATTKFWPVRCLNSTKNSYKEIRLKLFFTVPHDKNFEMNLEFVYHRIPIFLAI